MLAETLAPQVTKNPDFAATAAGPACEVTTFAEALVVYRAANEAHSAACSAYSVIEDDELAGKITRDHPNYLAAQAAAEAACDVDHDAWVALMNAPATSLEEIRLKIAALLEGEGVIHPEREQVCDADGMANPKGAICRIADDLARVSGEPPAYCAAGAKARQ